MATAQIMYNIMINLIDDNNDLDERYEDLNKKYDNLIEEYDNLNKILEEEISANRKIYLDHHNSLSQNNVNIEDMPALENNIVIKEETFLNNANFLYSAI